jgi:lipopolysaccharide transport system permease protein
VSTDRPSFRRASSDRQRTQPAQVSVYRPHERHDVGFWSGWRIMVGNVVQSRELIAQLFRRDFVAVYKKSFLGVTWILALPLLGVLPVLFLHAANILKPGVQGVPYTVFALFSVTLWQMFAGIVTLSMQSLSGSSALILQVKFPHEALLVKQCAQQLAVSVLALALSVVVLLAFGVVPDWKLALLPLMAIPIILLAAGTGLLLAVLSVVVADLERVMAYVLQLFLYATPIVYTAEVDNVLLQKIIDYNPLTYLIGDARDLVLFGAARHLDRYAYACAFALAVFLFAWRLFFMSEERVIERLG